MPRQARIKSESGIYHVMLRGINKQSLFEDDEDNDFFLSLLKDYKTECGFRLLAYCLMGNHAHLALALSNDSLSSIFRKISGKS